MSQPGRLAEMGRNAKTLGRPDSLDLIWAALKKLCA